jgi:hypothetical protein
MVATPDGLVSFRSVPFFQLLPRRACALLLMPRPLGYKLRVQIIDFPGGMPGDVGITLKWV